MSEQPNAARAEGSKEATVIEVAKPNESNSANASMRLENRFEDPELSGFRKKMANLKYDFREYIAEFLGTMMLVLFGDGSVAIGVLSPAAKDSFSLIMNVGFSFGLMFGVYIAAPVSGAHLNPAVTLALALLRGFSWKKVPGFILSQLLGGFVGAAFVMLFHFPAIQQLDQGVRATFGDTATAGIFATYPPDFVSNTQAFFIELFSTFLLVLIVLVVLDKRHDLPTWVAPILIGSGLGVIGVCTGWLTGFALNPARDLGPRIFTALAGWGGATFTHHNFYFWVPIVAPILGAILSVLTYDIFVSI